MIRLIGMANPIEPLRAAIVLTPTTCPPMSTSGPPELPGFTAASVWMKSNPGADGLERRALPAHDPERHGLLEPERVAEREHELPDREPLGVAEREHRQRLGGVHLDQGQVHAPVPADDGAGEPPARGEPHLDRRRALDDVGVGHDVAARVNDEARAERPPRALLGVRLLGLPLDADLDQRRLQLLREARQGAC